MKGDNNMKKFINWLKSPSSDFALLIVLLVLANLVGSRAFLRFDLTGPKSYSLSPASKQVVKNLDQPLSVKVFFSDNLPSPYNTTEQYINDMLVEYKGTANKNFSYQFFNMNDPENEKIAGDYGLNKVQIQEVKNNEVGFKQAWMGIAISYSDSIETLDSLTSSDGFEYKLTTRISRMISTADTLAGLNKNDKITITLYTSSQLKQFNINGFDTMGTAVQNAYEAINKKNMNQISFQTVDPPASEVEGLIQKYGMQGINWKNADGSMSTGVIGLVIEHGSTFRLIPLNMQHSLFGYAIAGLDDLQKTMTESLQGLLSKSAEIGYVTGDNEAELYDNNGPSRFSSLISDMYTFKELDLTKDTIPSNLTSIVINGPKKSFTDTELYKIDQFLMRGGNVMFFVDPFNEIQGQGYYQQSAYIPLDTGLKKLLNTYGVKTGTNYVLDESCYTTQQQNYGNLSLYWAPIIQKKQLAAKSQITKNLGYVIFLQSGSLDIDDAAGNSDVKTTVLATSSPKSWLITDNIQLNPMMIAPPSDTSKEHAENLAVLVEGKFRSAYKEAPADTTEQNKTDTTLTAQTHLIQSTQPGKIFVAGSSFITSSQLIDEHGSEPISLFIRNVVDYMNGNEDLCTMRTKGLSLNILSGANSPFALLAKYFNEFGLAILVAVAGLIIWHLRNKRRLGIRRRYNPDDSREITRKAKEGK
jgi:ABC-2 type transport system permease protein